MDPTSDQHIELYWQKNLLFRQNLGNITEHITADIMTVFSPFVTISNVNGFIFVNIFVEGGNFDRVELVTTSDPVKATHHTVGFYTSKLQCLD